VSEKSLRNGGNLGFLSRRRPSRARLGLWGGNRYKKIVSGGKWGYIDPQPKGKTEIPAETCSTVRVVREGDHASHRWSIAS